MRELIKSELAAVSGGKGGGRSVAQREAHPPRGRSAEKRAAHPPKTKTAKIKKTKTPHPSDDSTGG